MPPGLCKLAEIRDLMWVYVKQLEHATHSPGGDFKKKKARVTELWLTGTGLHYLKTRNQDARLPT